MLHPFMYANIILYIVELVHAPNMYDILTTGRHRHHRHINNQSWSRVFIN